MEDTGFRAESKNSVGNRVRNSMRITAESQE